MFISYPARIQAKCDLRLILEYAWQPQPRAVLVWRTPTSPDSADREGLGRPHSHEHATAVGAFRIDGTTKSESASAAATLYLSIYVYLYPLIVPLAAIDCST